MLSSKQDSNHRYIWIVVLGQAVIYLALWLWNEYVASYLTLIFPALIFVILILSLIADWIEPARIPGWYYMVMLLSIAIPLIIGALFYFINGGNISWLRQI
ncbi:MAG: hypothetical protein ABJC12_01145 [Saprospiraceae bacterium]